MVGLIRHRVACVPTAHVHRVVIRVDADLVKARLVSIMTDGKLVIIVNVAILVSRKTENQTELPVSNCRIDKLNQG